MEIKKTIEEMLDDEEESRGFSCIGEFPKDEIEGVIGNVSMEEGGYFETVGAFEKDGNTSKNNWLKLYHHSKYQLI